MSRWVAVDRAASPAGLLDDQLNGGEIPERKLALACKIDGALRDEAVLPEIAEATLCPGACGDSTPGVGHVTW